jgi:hypothetical protein
MAKDDRVSVMVPRALWEEIVRRAENTQPKLSAAQMMELLLRRGIRDFIASAQEEALMIDIKEGD